MNYNEYISSTSWAIKRKARLILDGYRCRLCDEDGTRYRLEVHHRPSSYAKIPNESVEDDLVTVCSRCHDFITASIRGDRYGRKDLPEAILISTIIKPRKEISHGMANSSLSVDLISPADSAQRADGRSAKQVGEIDKTDFIEAQKDRRRL